MRFNELVASADAIASENQSASVAGVTERLRAVDLSEEEFNSLPFGAIELDEEGVILRYNDYESRLSGIARDKAAGKHFFKELAPCTDVREFHGRFKEGAARRQLHEKFRYHFAFRRNPIDVTVTLFYSEISRSIWVFVRPV